MTLDPLKAYKRSLTDPVASKKYEEGWDRIFKKNEKSNSETNEANKGNS